jgi:hypothetical protein
MVGIMAAVALLFIKPRSLSASSRGYADEVAALCDAVRQRAVASHIYQRVEVATDGVVQWQWQPPDAGLLEPTIPIEPDEWKRVGSAPVPAEVLISAVSIKTHVDRDTDVPDPGENLPADIIFTPEGTTLQPATIFIEDSHSENRARVAIYPATGSVYAYQEW